MVAISTLADTVGTAGNYYLIINNFKIYSNVMKRKCEMY